MQAGPCIPVGLQQLLLEKAEAGPASEATRRLSHLMGLLESEAGQHPEDHGDVHVEPDAHDAVRSRVADVLKVLRRAWEQKKMFSQPGVSRGSERHPEHAMRASRCEDAQEEAQGGSSEPPGSSFAPRRALDEHADADDGVELVRLCPGRRPPLLAVRRSARPCKRAIRNRFAMGNAKGA